MIADLKQFISAELHQQTSEQTAQLRDEMHTIRDELRGEIVEVRSELNAKIDTTRDEILDAIGETTSVRNEIVDEQIAGLDVRITKLERQTA